MAERGNRTRSNRAVGNDRAVIPVMLPGAPVKADLPFPLGNRHEVDFRNGFNEEELRSLVRDIKKAAGKD